MFPMFPFSIAQKKYETDSKSVFLSILRFYIRGFIFQRLLAMLSATLLFQCDSFGGDENRGRLRASTVQFISCGQDKVSGVFVVFFKEITYERVDPGSGFALLGAKQDMKG